MAFIGKPSIQGQAEWNGSGWTVTGSFGPYSSRSLPGVPGRSYLCTDSPISQWVDDGTVWRPLIMGQIMGSEPPSSASFVAFNQGTSDIKQLNGALQVTGSNDGASFFTLRGFVQSTSQSNVFVEVASAIQPNQANAANTFSVIGAILRESSTQKAYTILHSIAHSNQTSYVETDVHSANATRVTNITAGFGLVNGPLFLRLRRSGSLLHSDISMNRIVWTQIDSRATTSVFTTAPDQIGIVVCGASVVPHGYIIHYLTGTSW